MTCWRRRTSWAGSAPSRSWRRSRRCRRPGTWSRCAVTASTTCRPSSRPTWASRWARAARPAVRWPGCSLSPSRPGPRPPRRHWPATPSPAVRVAPASPRARRPCWPSSPSRCGYSPWSPGARRRAGFSWWRPWRPAWCRCSPSHRPVTSWRWPCRRPGSSPRWPPWYWPPSPRSPSGVASAQGIVTWGSWTAVSGNAAYPPGGTVPVGCRCRPRWTALSKTLTPRPRATRSAIIWPVTTSRATSVLAVMSPNPTVANTVTVK